MQKKPRFLSICHIIFIGGINMLHYALLYYGLDQFHKIISNVKV